MWEVSKPKSFSITVIIVLTLFSILYNLCSLQFSWHGSSGTSCLICWVSDPLNKDKCFIFSYIIFLTKINYAFYYFILECHWWGRVGLDIGNHQLITIKCSKSLPFLGLTSAVGHLLLWIFAFESRAGAAPSSRRGCSILAFSKITQQFKFIVSKAKLGCYWQLSTWIVNSFHLSKKLRLRSLTPFLLPAFWKAINCPRFPGLPPLTRHGPSPGQLYQYFGRCTDH